MFPISSSLGALKILWLFNGCIRDKSKPPECFVHAVSNQREPPQNDGSSDENRIHSSSGNNGNDPYQQVINFFTGIVSKFCEVVVWQGASRDISRSSSGDDVGHAKERYQRVPY